MGFRLDEAGIALLKVGKETPGPLLRLEEALHRREPVWASARVWLEVRDARAAARALAAAGVGAEYVTQPTQAPLEHVQKQVYSLSRREF